MQPEQHFHANPFDMGHVAIPHHAHMGNAHMGNAHTGSVPMGNQWGGNQWAHPEMQHMHMMGHMMGMEPHFFPQLAQQQLVQQQFAQQQFMHPHFAQQQFAMQPQMHQGFMTNGVHPQMHPHMMPYGNMHAMAGQFGHLDPNVMSFPNMGAFPNMGNYPNMGNQYMHPQFQQADARANGRESTNGAREPDNPEWSLNNLVPLRVSSPLAETMFVAAQTLSPFSTPPGPDKGVGRPLVGMSWLDHPYYFGGFIGGMRGSELVSGLIEQKDGGTGGLTFGYYMNDYWGLESRLHFASINIRDTDYARALLEAAWDPELPMPPRTTRSNQLTIFDVSVHYYPLGNAKWRPYFKYGLGVGRQTFVNSFGFDIESDIITMPMGMGMRYWWNERLAVQLDLTCNTIFATSNTRMQHNVAFTMGLTYAFGTGRRTPPVLHWPATPSMGARW